MSTKTSVGVERRRKADLVRQEALEVGRRLLIDAGPRAITLKAIGAELGMSHANLIHHFGSAEAYQACLKDLMVQDLTRQVTTIVSGPQGAAPDTAALVEKVFAAYGRGGIAMLMAWSALTGAPHDEAGLAATTRELVAALTPLIDSADAAARAREIVALVTLLAFADSLIGASLADAVGAPRDAVRQLAARLVEGLACREAR